MQRIYLNNNVSRGLPRSDSSIAISDYHMHLNLLETANKLKAFKENFNLKGIHKFTINNNDLQTKNKYRQRKIKGKVISTTENIVTLQLEHYRESFTMASFFCNEIVMEG